MTEQEHTGRHNIIANVNPFHKDDSIGTQSTVGTEPEPFRAVPTQRVNTRVHHNVNNGNPVAPHYGAQPSISTLVTATETDQNPPIYHQQHTAGTESSVPPLPNESSLSTFEARKRGENMMDWFEDGEYGNDGV